MRSLSSGHAHWATSHGRYDVPPLLKDIVASIKGDGTVIGLQGLRLSEALDKLTSVGRVGKAGGGGIYDYDERSTSMAGAFDCFPHRASSWMMRSSKTLLYTQSLEAVRAIEEGVIENPWMPISDRFSVGHSRQLTAV